jgi:hypothetical protein
MTVALKKLVAFAAGLAVVFAAALGLGRVVGPVAAGEEPERHTMTQPAGSKLPGGLQVAQDGYRLIPGTTNLSSAAAAPFTFQILGPDGNPVTAFTPTHDKDLHLILARRDLTGFQHLHPSMAPDGTWSVPIATGSAGPFRIFADFQPAARAEPLTLGVDAASAGMFEPAPLPAASRETTVDGYAIALTGDLVPGSSSTLTLSVSRGGTPVIDLEPYLAAYGHLVALRDGDLAYLHVHPDGTPADGRTAAGPAITFHVEVPSAGAFRLFLDFQHSGRVHTAAFTAVAGPETPAGQTATVPAPGHDAGHGHA